MTRRGTATHLAEQGGRPLVARNALHHLCHGFAQASLREGGGFCEAKDGRSPRKALHHLCLGIAPLPVGLRSKTLIIDRPQITHPPKLPPSFVSSSSGAKDLEGRRTKISLPDPSLRSRMTGRGWLHISPHQTGDQWSPLRELGGNPRTISATAPHSIQS